MEQKDEVPEQTFFANHRKSLVENAFLEEAKSHPRLSQ